MKISEQYPLGKEIEYFGHTMMVPEWTKSVCTDEDGSIWCLSVNKRYVHFNGCAWVTDWETSGYLLGHAEIGTFSAKDSLVEYE